MAVVLPHKRLDLSRLKAGVGTTTKSIQWEYMLEYGVDEFFVGRGVKIDGTEYAEKASTFWEQVSYAEPFPGRFKLPGNLKTSAVYSRKAFRYPILIYRGRFPNPPAIADYVAFYIGLEHGGATFNGILSYLFNPGGTAKLAIGAPPSVFHPDLNPVFAPDANEHVFKIYHGEYISMFMIDDRIVAFVVQNERPEIITMNQPYMVVTSRKLPESLSVLLEFLSSKTAPSDDAYVDGPSYWNIRVSESDGHHPVLLKLYRENTTQTLEGLTISGTIYSHPFPLLYRYQARLSFQSSGSGTIYLESFEQPGIYTVRSYSYSANTLLLISLPHMPVARIRISAGSTQTIQIANLLLF